MAEWIALDDVEITAEWAARATLPELWDERVKAIHYQYRLLEREKLLQGWQGLAVRDDLALTETLLRTIAGEIRKRVMG